MTNQQNLLALAQLEKSMKVPIPQNANASDFIRAVNHNNTIKNYCQLKREELWRENNK